MPSDADRWFAVIRTEEILPNHIVPVQLFGHEIALWRDATGALNAWEDRCPHRGVRLSIGFNTGTELRCQYHGWRFASGSGRCTYIPAHPTQTPASTIHATPYACADRHGFAWVSLGQPADAPSPPPTTATHAAGNAITLRSLIIDAPAASVGQALCEAYGLIATDSFTLSGAAAARGPAHVAHTLTFFLQPQSAAHTVVHGHVSGQAPHDGRLALLREFHSGMTAVRDAVEHQLRAHTAPRDAKPAATNPRTETPANADLHANPTRVGPHGTP